jgi:hypothetical protein
VNSEQVYIPNERLSTTYHGPLHLPLEEHNQELKVTGAGRLKTANDRPTKMARERGSPYSRRRHILVLAQ